jgi:hypothetical protein
MFTALRAPPVSLTPWWQMEKSLIIKVFIFLFGHLWEVELTYRYIFAFKFTLRSQQPDIVPLLATGVIDTNSKFAAGVVDTSGKLPLLSTTLANLPPVSLMPVVHFDLRISPQIF